MKKKVRFSCYAVTLVAFTFLNVSVVSGQGNVSITAGFGFPDLLNAGIRYQIGRAQIGISAGFMPVAGESVTSALFDVHYHFAGSSALSARQPWYGRLGLSYLHDKKEGSFDEKFVFVGIRAGREFNISEHFGIAIDAGLMYKLYSDVEENDLARLIDSITTGFPAGGLGLFYRF